MAKSILVTGGAGYIGSHVVKMLGQRDEHLIVLDNLSTGFRNAVTYGEFICGDVGDIDLVQNIFSTYEIDTVFHFAAHTIVPESVADPLKYYGNNTANTRNLLSCCQAAQIKHFVFSSTAAVYGVPETGTCTEMSPLQPINPYGTSKLMSEWMIRDLAQISPLRHVTLRYFNVAGCDPQGEIGQSTKNATLLIKVACETALGKRAAIKIFGTDYPTKDGTGIRDYIHVMDLADAHVKALDYLRAGGCSTTLNCGYGHGYSVREVLDTVLQAHGQPFRIIEEGRRDGDPPVLIAAADKVHATLNWTPSYDDLATIVESSLAWEQKLIDLPNYE